MDALQQPNYFKHKGAPKFSWDNQQTKLEHRLAQ